MATLLRFVLQPLFPITLCVAASVAAGQVEQPVLAEFSARVQAYFELHRRVEEALPVAHVSRDPAEIRRTTEALGKAIRAARKDARQGDIFTPDVVPLFRRWIAEGCGGSFRDLLAIAHDETPPLPRPRVNGKWPGDGVTVMPPNVLCRFPQLPEGLEYRFVNRDLVLWDSHANLIVDIIANAVPSGTEED